VRKPYVSLWRTASGINQGPLVPLHTLFLPLRRTKNRKKILGRHAPSSLTVGRPRPSSSPPRPSSLSLGRALLAPSHAWRSLLLSRLWRSLRRVVRTFAPLALLFALSRSSAQNPPFQHVRHFCPSSAMPSRFYRPRPSARVSSVRLAPSGLSWVSPSVRPSVIVRPSVRLPPVCRGSRRPSVRVICPSVQFLLSVRQVLPSVTLKGRHSHLPCGSSARSSTMMPLRRHARQPGTLPSVVIIHPSVCPFLRPAVCRDLSYVIWRRGSRVLNHVVRLRRPPAWLPLVLVTISSHSSAT
jgi:hypothetical protein